MPLYVDSQFASPYAMSAFVALAEKAIDFELVPVDLVAGGQHSPRYAQLLRTRALLARAEGRRDEGQRPGGDAQHVGIAAERRREG